MNLAEEFKAVLLARKNGREFAVYNYADKDDFGRLWKLPKDDDSTEAKSGITSTIAGKSNPCILIVWGGMPDHQSATGNLLAPHLTPLDWALAFSMKRLAASATDETSTEFSVHIIDLTVKQFEDAYALRMCNQLLVEMPWVKLYAPLVPVDEEVKDEKRKKARYRRCHDPITDIDSLMSSFSTTDTMAASIRGQKDSVKRALDIIANAWRASLVQTGDHHDLNNVIGPALLLPAGEASGSPLLQAIVTRLDWSGVFPNEKPGIPGQLDLDKDFSGPLNVLVIDDQIDQGWGALVSKLFRRGPRSQSVEVGGDRFVRLDENAGNNDCRIFGVKTARPLVEKLKKTDFTKRDFSLRFGANTDEGREIILLDLRLHPAGTKEETSFYGELVEIAGKVQREHAAWEPISADELGKVQNYLDNPQSNSEGQYCAIALLAKLLALAAPLTPIVIFSSTGRSRLKDKFKAYRNIFTDFEKPRVLTEPDAASDFLHKLQSAVNRALRILEFQERLERMAQIAREAENIRPKTESDHHIEFFFDESGDKDKKNFTCAGAVFAFEDKSGADNLQERCFEEFKNLEAKSKPAIWARERNAFYNDTRLRKFSDFKGHDRWTQFCDEVDRFIGDVLSVAKGQGYQRYVVAVKRGGKKVVSDGSPLKACFRDQQMDLMLRFALEFGLCVLPRFLKQNIKTAGIYFDVRSAPCKNNGTIATYSDYEKIYEAASKEATPNGLGLTHEEKLTEAQFNAIDPKKRNLHIKYYDTNSYFPLVASTLSRWPDERTSSIEFVAIRGVQLSWGNFGGITRKEAKERRLVHDIADWVAGCVRSEDFSFRKKMYAIFPKPQWYVADYSPAKILPLMNAAREFAHKHRGEGLRHLISSKIFHEAPRSADVSVLQRVLFWTCGQEVEKSNGADLFYALEAWENGLAIQKAKHKGSDKSSSSATIPVTPKTETTSKTKAGNEGLAKARQYARFLPPRGEIFQVIGTDSENGKKYWKIGYPTSPDNVIGYVACHEGNPAEKANAFMVAEDTAETVKNGTYCVFKFSDWLGEPNDDELSDSDMEDKSQDAAVAPIDQRISQLNAETEGNMMATPIGEQPHTSISNQAEKPVVISALICAARFNSYPRGWIVEDEAGVSYLLRSTAATRSLKLQERVAILPKDEFCMVQETAIRLADLAPDK